MEKAVINIFPRQTRGLILTNWDRLRNMFMPVILENKKPRLRNNNVPKKWAFIPIILIVASCSSEKSEITKIGNELETIGIYASPEMPVAYWIEAKYFEDGMAWKLRVMNNYNFHTEFSEIGKRNNLFWDYLKSLKAESPVSGNQPNDTINLTHLMIEFRDKDGFKIAEAVAGKAKMEGVDSKNIITGDAPEISPSGDELEYRGKIKISKELIDRIAGTKITFEYSEFSQNIIESLKKLRKEDAKNDPTSTGSIAH